MTPRAPPVAAAAAAPDPAADLDLRPGKSQAAFRTISEVADELDVAQHVLRFWESKFPQVRPMKRGGGRRYYRPEDVEALRQIRKLLYDEGYTIKGAQRSLRARRTATRDAEPRQADLGGPLARSDEPPTAPAHPLPRPKPRLLPADTRRALERLQTELTELRALLARALHEDG